MQVKVKVKFTLKHATKPQRERIEVQLYSFLNFGTRLQLSDQRHAPAALTPGKTRYPLYTRLGGHQGWSGRVRKILPYRDSIFGPPNPQRVSISMNHVNDRFQTEALRKSESDLYVLPKALKCSFYTIHSRYSPANFFRQNVSGA